MLDTRGTLQSVEGDLKNICLKLGVTEAQHITGAGEVRRRKLLTLTLNALSELDEGNGASLSLEEPTLGQELDSACDALSRRMGWLPPGNG